MKRENEEFEIDLGKLFMALWRKAGAILLAGVVFAALFFSYARFFVTPMYEASALLYVNNSPLSTSSSAKISTTELNAASDLVDIYAAILESRSNLDLVRERSGLAYSYEKLQKMVSAQSVNSTGLFRVNVRSSDPEEACALANVIAEVLPEKIAEIVTNSSVEVVDYAVAPNSRVSPSYFKYSALGLLLGIVLAGALVILADLRDDVIHDEDYLLTRYDAPVLATIPDLMAKTPRKYGYGYAAASGAAKKGGKA